MRFVLSEDTERLFEEKLRSGRYRTAEEVVLAGLASLEQAERFGDVSAGEWDALLAAGEKSLADGNAIDAARALDDNSRRIPDTFI